MSDEKSKAEAARAAFVSDSERFAELNLNGSSVSDAETMLREVGELRVRHTGKKSELAAAKKLIGKVAPEERGEFGQLVQSVENEIVSRITELEAKLNEFISNAKTERDRLDVTIPGR